VTAVRVRYAIGGIAAAALIALPATAAAASGGQVASLAAQQCSRERAVLGRKAFRKRYGSRRAMRSCLKRTRPQVASALDTANADCQEELALIGPVEFVDEFGLDPSATVDDAMAECIAENLHPYDYGDDDISDDSSDG
jgi:hypothetical protein